MLFLDKLRQLKREQRINKVLNQDIKEYKDYYSDSNKAINTTNSIARDILVYCHVVEKGLSHKNIKPLFGYEKVLMIAEKLNKYLEMRGGTNLSFPWLLIP